MPRPSALTRLAALALLALLAGSLAACDAEGDLVDYFGFEPPPPGATPTPTPSPSPAPTPTPMPTPTSTPIPSPKPEPTPTAPPGRTPTVPASPTRPPNLPAFSVLRERAMAVAPDRIAAQPGRYEGTLLFFEGRVLEVTVDGNGQFSARVRSGGGVVVLLYDEATYWGQPLVEGDRIRVVGYLAGISDRNPTPVIEVHDLIVRFT